MNIEINGDNQTIESKSNVFYILGKNNVENPDLVSVQLNGEFLQREDFETTFLSENDKLEFMYFVGGGAIWCPVLQQRLYMAKR